MNADLSNKLLLSPFQEVLGQCDQPVLVEMDNIETMFVLVFDSEDKLHDEMAFCGVKYYKIKKVDDVSEFIDSIYSNGLRIMFNPYRTEIGTTKWIEITVGGQK